MSNTSNFRPSTTYRPDMNHHSYILLDIDGVMNSAKSIHEDGVHIDPANVQHLKTICMAAPGRISIHLISAWCMFEEKKPGMMKELLRCAGLNKLGVGRDLTVENAYIASGLQRHTQEGILNILQGLYDRDDRTRENGQLASVVIISDDYREGMHEEEPHYNDVRCMTTNRLVECKWATGLTEEGAWEGVKLIRDPAPWDLIVGVKPEFRRGY